uniref:Sushi domain-containing protein n=1 Tax=Ditylenchus dipsaci TaxID=166011 RepID=A0A915DKN5_9BILA
MQILKCRRYSCFFAFFLICLNKKLCEGVPKAIDLLDASQLDSYKPNYCNDTEIMVQNGLLKSPLGQFVGYPCSNEFFHCRWQSDGYRTYKKNCRPGWCLPFIS